MIVGLRPSCRPGLRVRLELAGVMEATEFEVESRVRVLERNPLFARLREAGAIALDLHSSRRFAARRAAGRELRADAGAVPELLDGHGEIAELIRSLGQEVFQREFLAAGSSSGAECAARCGISDAEVRRLRDFVDRLYIQQEFVAHGRAPESIFSSIGRITVEANRPELAFFSRDIWAGRYRLNSLRSTAILADLPVVEARAARALLREAELIDRRKTTLYAVLEVVLETQTDYFVSGEAARRRPLSQRDLAARLDVCPSVINRLVSNKAVELPWGVEVPLKALLPSRKAVLRDQAYQLASAMPELSDRRVSEELARRFGVRLSIGSINHYRRECGLPWRGNPKELVPA